MKKKLLFVTNTMGLAGAEKALCALLSSLDYEKYEVSVLSLFNRGEMFRDIPPFVKIMNSKPNSRGVTDIRGLLSFSCLCVKALLYRGYVIRRFPLLFTNFMYQIKSGRIQPEKLFWHAIAGYVPKCKESFDLAVAYLEGGAAYYVSQYVKAKVKVGFLHVDYQRSKYNPKQDYQHFAAMKKIICVSKGVEASFHQAFPNLKEKTEAAENIILSAEIVKKAEEGKGFTDDFKGIRFLTIGRLHYQKAYDIAIEAMSILKQRGYRNIRWYVLGDGALKRKLLKQSERMNVSDCFIFLGKKVNPYPFLKQCDIYIQASRFEGWSIAIAEALVLKKIIIASNCTGTKEQIADGKTGILIELTAENLANAAEEVLNNEKLRINIEKELNDHSFEADKTMDKIKTILNL